MFVFEGCGPRPWPPVFFKRKARQLYVEIRKTKGGAGLLWFLSSLSMSSCRCELCVCFHAMFHIAVHATFWHSCDACSLSRLHSAAHTCPWPMTYTSVPPKAHLCIVICSAERVCVSQDLHIIFHLPSTEIRRVAPKCFAMQRSCHTTRFTYNYRHAAHMKYNSFSHTLIFEQVVSCSAHAI